MGEWCHAVLKRFEWPEDEKSAEQVQVHFPLSRGAPREDGFYNSARFSCQQKRAPPSPMLARSTEGLARCYVAQDSRAAERGASTTAPDQQPAGNTQTTSTAVILVLNCVRLIAPG